ncbi:hypothetical protein CKY04_18255 [Photorhabdus sp. S8-52]|nr:hypothetical protein CKY03_18750 [Photorhabdus sp. S9-53]RAW95074.1 hypothetical protein CKY05_18540 [Photorhabdus sp. S10-54]RAW99159.1 hypothetical protein CKY04_18255 [Photorhabdus sp. S8-52]
MGITLRYTDFEFGDLLLILLIIDTAIKSKNMTNAQVIISIVSVSVLNTIKLINGEKVEKIIR